MAAPYTIINRPDGGFDIRRNAAADAPAPTADELVLAGAIADRLDWVRNNQGQIGDPAAFIAALREVAELGLARDPGRNFQAARQQFVAQFGDPQPAAANGPTGAFQVYLRNGEIRVRRLAGPPEPTDDQRKFLGELIQQERMVRALYQRGIRDDAERTPRVDAAIQRLAWAAGLGLEGQHADVALARLASQAVLTDAIQENGAGVRGAYLRELAGAYVMANILLIIVIAAFYAVPRRLGTSEAFIVPGQTLALLATALLSLSIGAWLIAAYRLQPDSPEILSSLFATTTSSWIRATLVLGFGFLGLLLFYKQVIVFSFGPSGASVAANGFTTALVLSKLSAAVLAGGLLGLGDAALPSAVIARSANLVAALAPR